MILVSGAASDLNNISVLRLAIGFGPPAAPDHKEISRIAAAANWAQASARVRKCLIDNAGSVRLDPRRLDQRGVRPDLAADHRLELAWRNFQLIGAEFGELLGQRRRRQRFDDLSM